MIERYYSADYDGKFYALCDEIELPFYGISGWYQQKSAIPFVFYHDDQERPMVEVGLPGDTHSDILATQLHNKIPRVRVLCGRFWDCGYQKLLTIWEDDSPREFLTAQSFKTMCNLLKNNNLNLFKSKLIFEANEDLSIRCWFPKGQVDDYFIYAIPITEYISKGMSSFDDVVKQYEIDERKRAKSSSMPKGKYDAYDYKNMGVGSLGYHLLAYMDENKNMINEGVLANELPEDIKMSILNNTTSLGNNPAIPDVYDIPFLLKLANERFESTKETLYEIGTIDDFEDTEIETMLSKLIMKCKEIERPFRDKLEKLCVNYVIDTFNIPEDTVQINVSLVDKVDMENSAISVEPVDGDFEFDDVNAAANIRGEVFKRRILDAICMGESIVLSSDIDSYADSINEISPELCELYLKILALNNYSLYKKENLGISDTNKMQMGTVLVEFGSEDEMVRITSQGEIFPVLLSETLRGFMELFISHGLPKDKKIADLVIQKSDFLKAEPWDMRLGPSLWILLSKSFNDITLDELPYLLKRIACLNVDKFNFLMKEVFAKTKKGKLIMSKICNMAKNDIEYDRFTDRMSKMKMDKSIITDEFINEEEL